MITDVYVYTTELIKISNIKWRNVTKYNELITFLENRISSYQKSLKFTFLEL